MTGRGTEPSRLAQVLDTLIEHWCSRRALDPLRYLLPSWPGPLVHSDQWHELWGALQNIRGLGPEALSAEERDLHAEALRLVHGALRAVGQSPYRE